MQMQNLKITFLLKSPTILNRLTTIDGLILSAYYGYAQSKGKKYPFDKEHKRINFIHKENGVFSGSVWYIKENADILFDFMTITKKPEYRKIFEVTKEKKTYNSKMKSFIGSEESFSVDEVYFYIKANKEIVEALLISQISHIGKKQNIGYGEVENIIVEEIEEDKGYMLNKTTASKPLPIKYFNVDSKKVAQMRPMPPYWLEEDSTPCYMPTSSLYEKTDNSIKNSEFIFKDIDYKHNAIFLYEQSKNKKNIKFKALPHLGNFKNPKGCQAVWVEDNSDLKCGVTNTILPQGMKNDIDKFMNKYKQSFSDYLYFKNYSFLSKEVLWCIQNINEISYSFVNKDSWLYLQGKDAKEGTKYKDFLKNPKLLKPPFSINLKDTQNAQHISFKGKVSISNAFFTVQYGNSQLHVDNELLQEAIKEIDKITADGKITKTHLCGNFGDSFHAELKKKENNTINRTIINNFMKKYNRDIRFVLSRVSLA